MYKKIFINFWQKLNHEFGILGKVELTLVCAEYKATASR